MDGHADRIMIAMACI